MYHVCSLIKMSQGRLSPSFVFLVKVDGILWWMVSEASTGIIECESCPQQLKCLLVSFNKKFLMVQAIPLNVFKTLYVEVVQYVSVSWKSFFVNWCPTSPHHIP